MWGTPFEFTSQESEEFFAVNPSLWFPNFRRSVSRTARPRAPQPQPQPQSHQQQQPQSQPPQQQTQPLAVPGSMNEWEENQPLNAARLGPVEELEESSAASSKKREQPVLPH